ncbi:MAG: alpha/beta hydrolase [Verrucomicrobiota bacterium]
MKSTAILWFNLVCVIPFTARLWAVEPVNPIALWPDRAPGEPNTVSTERDMTKPGEGLVAGKRVMRLGNVSQPSITIYRPTATPDTGTAVVICPGGGYSILAWDLEGTEVCDWLNSIGVTGVILKYRVPKRANGPLQDVQRAVGLVRHRAKEFGIDPQRIGVLGFSAGGHLAAEVCANSSERAYPVVDAADAVSCRPDFQILIYPAYLMQKDDLSKLNPAVAVTTNTPPTFLVMAADDPVRVENVLGYALALKQSKVPVELHVYPTGGHGYGLRRTPEPVTTWPDRATEWMKNRGWLEHP